MMTVVGGVFLRNGFKAYGEVRLLGANITGELNCIGGRFLNPRNNAFDGRGMKVVGPLLWRNLEKKPVGKVILSSASLSNLVDDEASWPEPGCLSIDALTYGSFATLELADWKMRLRWLDLRNLSDTSVQPYEQLIHVLRQMGLTEDARHIAIAKHRKLRQQQRGAARIWNWLLDKTIAYGYRPERVILLFILPIIVLGALVFALAFNAGVMEPSESLAQTMGPFLRFDPFWYSLDVFLPIVDLHQESAWMPNAGKPWGLFFQYYKYLHILAGWFFTTLAVAAVTGLVRKD